MKKTLLLPLILLLPFIIQAQAITISGNNSIYQFNITCTNTPSQVACPPATLTYSCQIDNAAFINYVEFKIANTWYNTTQNFNNFTITIPKNTTLTLTNTTINLTQQRIHDTNNGYINSFQTASIIHDCPICTPTTTTIQACNTTNEAITNTTYQPINCQNDTQGPTMCIYCTPTWLARTGGIYDCTTNSTKLQYYDDYSSCCTDSPINCIYPIDHNTITSCNYLLQDLSCQYDNQPYLTGKINIQCSIPTNGTYDCLTYVRKANQTLLIQTNPEYRQVPNLMFWKENEPRTSFTNTGRLVNAYYTDKYLETGQEFILGIKCTNTQLGNILTSEYAITPTYKTPTSAVNRMAWLQDNWAYTIIWIFTAILIIYAISWALKKIRGR